MSIKAKKSLGQNFLKSKEALRLIVEAGDISDKDTVLEVGPGKGALTELLLAQAKKVIAVEKDRRLIPILEEKFSQEIKTGKLEIVEQDILETDPASFGTYKIIANIPYYITGILLRMFLSSDNQPERMVLLLQKEVAKRIVAKDKKESILSLSVKAYGQPRYVKTVQAKYFSPQPKVDSAIISIENISKESFSKHSSLSKEKYEETFFRIVKTGFAHKRKKLIGNLKSIIAIDTLESIFQTLSINKNARPEDLDISQWLALTETMATSQSEDSQDRSL